MARPATAAWSPLAGVRVLDFSAQLPGPLATAMMADLGADVLKIEPPGGEFGRHVGFGLFERVNRGKRSLVLDLKKAASRDIVARLAARADVAIETFRPGVAARLGIGPEQLSALQPALIYCSLSGYGQTGPHRDHPGHDISYLAAAGAMRISGEWGQPPHRAGLPVADIFGGAFAAVAILAALGERAATGKGRVIDLGLHDAALYATATRTSFNEMEGVRAHLFPTQGLFPAADGETIALAVVENQFWLKFVSVAGALDPELKHPRFATPAGRFEAGDELHRRIRELIASRPFADWRERFGAADVPYERCLPVAEAAHTQHVKARGLVQEQGGAFYHVFPAIVDGMLRPGAQGATAPRLGEHDTAVLEELGFTSGEIARFREGGVIAAATR